MNSERYFAFISYAREDVSLAKDIHRRIEAFRYPKTVSGDCRPQNKKFVREVFIDRWNLECSDSSFESGLFSAIDQSRYLIVLCSKCSKNKASWVHKEIRKFRESHEAKYVVPVLLGDKDESLPEELNSEEFTKRNMPKLEKGEGATEDLVAQILNCLLKVELTTIRAQLNSQRLRFLRMCTAVGVALTILFSVMAGGMYLLKRRADASRKVAEEHAEKIRKQAIVLEEQKMEIQHQMERACASEQVARHEKEISEESLSYIIETFKCTDPTYSGRRGLRVDEMLNANVDKISRIESWELREHLSVNIGSILDNLGSSANASNLIFSAVEINMRERPDSSQMAYSLYCAGWWYYRNWKYAEALACEERALGIYGTQPAAPLAQVAAVNNAIGVIAPMLGADYMPRANECLLRAIELATSGDASNRVSLATYYCNLGWLYRKQKKYGEAIRSFEKSADLLRGCDGQGQAQMAKALIGVGYVASDMTDFDVSIENLTLALRIRERIFGDAAFPVLHTLVDLGRVCYSAGNYDQSRSLLLRAKVMPQLDSDKEKGLRREIDRLLRVIEDKGGGKGVETGRINVEELECRQ